MSVSSGESGPATPASAGTAVSMARATLFAVLLALVSFALFEAAFSLKWGNAGRQTGPVGVVCLLVAFAVGVVAHEVLHAAGWVLAGRLPWSAVRFGFSKRALALYAHAKEPMRASAYRIGIVLPGLVTGLLPAFVGQLTGSYWLGVLGVCLCGSA
ncbi:MAG: DUF3267 domain-containing protein, partial [Anaerolineales bacterium]